jgi:hypothetical protein
MRAGAHLLPPTGPRTVITTHDYTRLPPPPSDDSDTSESEPEVSFYDTDNNLLVLGERYMYTTATNTYIGTYHDRVPHLIMFNNISRYPSGEPVSEQDADFNSANLFRGVIPSIHVIGDVPFIPVVPVVPVTPTPPPLTDNSDSEMEIGTQYTFTMSLSSGSGARFVGTYTGSASSIMMFSDLLMLPGLQPMDQNINIMYDANNRPMRYLQTGMKSHKRRRRIRKETKSKKRNPRTKSNKKKSNKKNKNKRVIN